MRYQIIFQAIYLAKASSIIVANSVLDLQHILQAKRLRLPEVFGLMFTAFLTQQTLGISSFPEAWELIKLSNSAFNRNSCKTWTIEGTVSHVQQILNTLIFENGYDLCYWSNRNNDKNTQTFYAFITSSKQAKTNTKIKIVQKEKKTMRLFQTLVASIHLKIPERFKRGLMVTKFL